MDPNVLDEKAISSSASDSETTTSSASANIIPSQSESQQPPQSSTALDNVPEGGLDAWMQVLGSWVILGVTWGLINSFGVFQTYYEKDMLKAYSESNVSWIGSLQGALLLLLGPISGPLYDAGYLRHLLWVGLMLVVLGQFMVSLATAYWHVLLAQGVCFGIGCGLTFVPATAIISQYFRRRRALVIGISATGSPVCGLVFLIIFGRLQPSIGFAWTARIIAFILLGLISIPLAAMHTRVPPPQSSSSSSSSSSPSSAAIASTAWRCRVVDLTALREPAFILYTTALTFAFMGMYVLFFYVQVFATAFDIGTADFRPYFVSLLSASSVVGRLGPPYLADKLGSLNVVAAMVLMSSVLCFGWIGIRDMAGLLVLVVLYGCASGAVVSVMPSGVVSLSPDISRVGTRMAMVVFSCGVSLLVGTPIAGAILGEGSDAEWKAVAAYSGGCLLASGVCVVLAIWQHWRVTGRKRA